ncbi:MAG: Regulatory protein PchR [Stenotrophomonas maltophilia]|nr:MAG: Regulatory protein PchR [Stenotrophomonas maltophilia]
MEPFRSSTFFDRQSAHLHPPGWQVDTLVLQPGLQVSLVAYEASTPAQVMAIDDNPHLHFSCLLDGDVSLRNGSKLLHMAKGQMMTTFAPAERFQFDLIPGHRNIELRITPECLMALAGDDYRHLSQDIDQAFCLRLAASTQRVQDAALRLARLLRDDTAPALLVHSAALEYLAWHLKSCAPPDREQSIPRREQRQLIAARERLLADLSEAPTIEQLARETGLNQLKLKRGFKALFDSSIYALFQRERMARARQLLQRHGVTETASMLGYSNISHFSAAFRKQYGVLPREARRGALE